MEQGIHIERLTERYLEQYALVHAQTWRETYDGMLPRRVVDAITPVFVLDLARRHPFDTVLLALAGDRVAGYAEYQPSLPSSDDAAEVYALYVLREYQGRGIGRRLFEAAMAATGSPERIVVWMFRDNTNALGFYEHMGFHATGRARDADGITGNEIELANFEMTTVAG